MQLLKSSDFEKLLEPVKEKALKIVNEKTFITECGFALQIINASPKLLEASQQSLMQAVYNIALTGLSLNPVLKMAYLIPRFSKGAITASLEVSYQGLVKLLTDTESVKSVYAHPVYEGDEFQVSLGTMTEIVHLPKYKTKTLEKVYAVAILHDGSKQIEVMTAQEINDIRDKSESYIAYKGGKIKSCIWVDSYSEMCRKTVIKRIAKYLPKTNRWEHFSQAVNIDNQDYIISNEFAGYLESMVETSVYDPEMQEVLIRKIHSGITTDEADNIKKDLMNNQRNPIHSGTNYSQTDIKNHLKELSKNV
jgi:recombination protein RecT